MPNLAPLPTSDFLAVQLDGDNVPFYPHFLAHPEAMTRVPGRMRDQIHATNLAYLAGRLAALEAMPTATPAPTNVPELVELRAKADELQELGVNLTRQRLCKLAELHRLPVLRTSGQGNQIIWVMSGQDWTTLARHIASPQHHTSP